MPTGAQLRLLRTSIKYRSLVNSPRLLLLVSMGSGSGSSIYVKADPAANWAKAMPFHPDPDSGFAITLMKIYYFSLIHSQKLNCAVDPRHFGTYLDPWIRTSASEFSFFRQWLEKYQQNISFFADYISSVLKDKK